MERTVRLSPGEWKLMELLWREAPRTIGGMVQSLREDTGWDKSTVFVMLGRMERKGAVRCEGGSRAKQYYPLLGREEASREEAESFLSRVYGGSIGLMVASLAGQKALSQADIDELCAILERAREDAP